MQVSCNRIFIFILVVIDSIKVMFFCISHQFKLIMNFCFCDCFDCNRNFLAYGYIITGKCNNKFYNKIFIACKTVYGCSVTIHLNRIIVCCYCDFFVSEYEFVIVILYSGVSWKLKIIGAVLKICSLLCSKVLDSIFCIIFIQNCLKFFFCRSCLPGAFNSYFEFFFQSSKIRYFLYIRIQHNIICIKGSCQSYFCIFRLWFDHALFGIDQGSPSCIFETDYVLI